MGVTTLLSLKADNRAHARLSASSSGIWLVCESAPALTLQAPPKVVGQAAEKGTVAHWLGEQMLRDPSFILPLRVSFNGVVYEIDENFEAAIEAYVHFVRPLMKDAIRYGIESHIDLAPLWTMFGETCPEPIFGSSDFWAILPGGLLIVVDYKNGAGKVVDPEGNSQLMFYALGVYLKLTDAERQTIARIELVVIQPNAPGKTVKQWTLRPGELLYWAFGTLRPAIDRIAAGTPGGFNPSPSTCWFCPAGVICEAKHADRTARAIANFPDYVEELEDAPV